eukprot:7107207-Prymnesium_polylepis.1
MATSVSGTSVMTSTTTSGIFCSARRISASVVESDRQKGSSRAAVAGTVGAMWVQSVSERRARLLPPVSATVVYGTIRPLSAGSPVVFMFVTVALGADGSCAATCAR